MKGILFAPFDIANWFVLGFTAFLAELADGDSTFGGIRWMSDLGDEDWEDVAIGTRDRIGELLESGIEIALLILLLFAAIVIGILLLWLSSRGKFLFLDNVVHRRARVTDPWHRYGRLGDSLFWWRILFGLVILIVIGTLVVSAVLSALPLIGEGPAPALGVLGLVLIGLLALLLGLVATFIGMLVDQFVVPMMYKHNLSVWSAWGFVLPLMRREAVRFILFGLFYLLLQILVAIVVIIFGLVTCCFGFLVLAIPYLGSVLLLPISVVFRGLGLEFIAQFGPEYSLRDLFPENRPPEAGAQTSTVS
jgi:hypothetical protein